jgi:hypothetical protein
MVTACVDGSRDTETAGSASIWLSSNSYKVNGLRLASAAKAG